MGQYLPWAIGAFLVCIGILTLITRNILTVFSLMIDLENLDQSSFWRLDNFEGYEQSWPVVLLFAVVEIVIGLIVMKAHLSPFH